MYIYIYIYIGYVGKMKVWNVSSKWQSVSDIRNDEDVRNPQKDTQNTHANTQLTRRHIWSCSFCIYIRVCLFVCFGLVHLAVLADEVERQKEEKGKKGKGKKKGFEWPNKRKQNKKPKEI